MSIVTAKIIDRTDLMEQIARKYSKEFLQTDTYELSTDIDELVTRLLRDAMTEYDYVIFGGNDINDNNDDKKLNGKENETN